MNQFFGKYRGSVKNITDPENRGRIQVNVPALHGEGQLNWALPSVPYAGNQKGFYAIPPVDANVWVEFEGGNLEFPIWSGCFWAESEVPGSAKDTEATTQHIAMQTTGTTLLLSDKSGSDGGLILKLSSGAKIEINSNGITISNGSGATIELTSSSVKINGTAFVVS
jgi:uncharacterized protein involved in type VI secretion and phage assembly